MNNDKKDLLNYSVEQRLRDLQHFGEEGGVVPAIDLASTTTFLNPQDMEKTFIGEKHGCYLYSRHSNPTVNMFSQKMAALENTEAALGVASGMSAIACTFEQLLQSGDEVISALTVYGGTYALLKNVLPRQNVKTHFVDINNFSEIEKKINTNTKIIYAETISNPLLNLAQIKKLSALAKKHQLKLIIDNTFAPCMITPAHFGADIVIHSCTKFISGASDLVAGAICGSAEFIRSLIDVNTGSVMLKGPIMDPKIAHELYLRLDHLPLRMRAHSKAALEFSTALEKQNISVIYPGLKNHPQHEFYKEVINEDYGFGGMVAVATESAEKAMLLAQALQDAKFGLYAVSLGFSRTLMTVPAITTSSEITAEDQNKMHLSKGLLRLSIGYTGHTPTMIERFIKVYQGIIR
jgi:methionine-gamma-lyase